MRSDIKGREVGLSSYKWYQKLDTERCANENAWLLKGVDYEISHRVERSGFEQLQIVS